MAEVTYNGGASLVYETGNHVTPAKHGAMDDVPSEMRWRDLHALDPTLGSRYKTAMEMLERLNFVVWGSRPIYLPSFKQWYHRQHPRCNWMAEQTKEVFCDLGTPNCNNMYRSYYEYGAMGSAAYGYIKPNVPIRSRSGDWKLQRVDGVRVHDDTWFPVGSVSRDDGSQEDYNGRQTYDPKGHGYFGGDPTMIGTDGDVQIVGEAVNVYYTPPEALASQVSEVWLHYNSTSVQMVLQPEGYYLGTIAAQDHNTLVEWYIELIVQPPVGDPYSRYDPGGESPPVSGKYYSYTAFSHYVSYPNGLPELWSKCAKSTDAYQFTDDETIQVGLINLARFVLDYLASRTIHHPATMDSIAQCCTGLPVRFRWSGSAPWPHYQEGGKDSTDWVTPLHNRDADDGDGSEAARMSWRGTDEWWGDNPMYGPGASWLTTPEYLWLDHFSYVDDDICAVYWRGLERGLQPGDVIHRSHIEEIIAAVNFIVDNGIWEKRPIKYRVLTPDFDVQGHPCGYGMDDGTPFDAAFTCRYRDPVTYEYSAYSAPVDWEDCWDNDAGDPPDKAPFGICYLSHHAVKSCSCSDGIVIETNTSERVECVKEAALESCSSYLAGGWIHNHGEWSAAAPPFEPEGLFQMCIAMVCEWAAYICGPQQCVEGVDAYHGNGHRKEREDGCDQNRRDDVVSWGNYFGETYCCASKTSDPDDHDIGFETVTAVHISSAADAWAGHCNAECEDCAYICIPWQTDVPELPGYPDYRYPDDPDGSIGEMLCEGGCDQTGPAKDSEYTCGLGIADCAANYVWAAIDLNLDENGMPTLRDYAESPSEDVVDALIAGCAAELIYPTESQVLTELSTCPCGTFTGPTCENTFCARAVA